MAEPVKRIVIVGGGTAGWLAACRLSASVGSDSGQARSITLIEAPNIPTIGVGEGTWPTMRTTLSSIGLDEADVLASCDAAFKQGSRFDGWVTGDPDDSYHHPFTPPPEGDPLDLVSAWRELVPGVPFGVAVSAQPAVCQRQLAPRHRSMSPYAGALNYAYHLDAAKLALRLSKHAVDRLGVTHLRDEVIGVDAHADGDIAAVQLRGGECVEGDLFIDCSGQAALLIGSHFGVEWIDLGHILANDRALAVQLPVAADSPVQSQTIATAHEAGWLWDIGLPTRRGIGCVYSSRFLDDERANAILRDYVVQVGGEAAAQVLNPRILSFPTGHRAEFWRGNCLAIGLSAGFIEPLEASAIVMIELSLRALIDNFPVEASSMPLHARRFNDLFRIRWERIVDFLKLHYVLSRRKDPYWVAQRNHATIPDRLAELLALWRDQPPSTYDFPLADEIFPAASHQYVYYGMGGALPARASIASEAMRRQVGQVRERTRGLLAALPANRALLDSMAMTRVSRDKAVQA